MSNVAALIRNRTCNQHEFYYIQGDVKQKIVFPQNQFNIEALGTHNFKFFFSFSDDGIEINHSSTDTVDLCVIDKNTNIVLKGDLFFLSTCTVSKTGGKITKNTKAHINAFAFQNIVLLEILPSSLNQNFQINIRNDSTKEEYSRSVNKDKEYVIIHNAGNIYINEIYLFPKKFLIQLALGLFWILFVFYVNIFLICNKLSTCHKPIVLSILSLIVLIVAVVFLFLENIAFKNTEIIWVVCVCILFLVFTILEVLVISKGIISIPHESAFFRN